MTTTPLTLRDLVDDDGYADHKVLVEHGRCGRSLGPHFAWSDDEGGVHLGDGKARWLGAKHGRGRGPATTPGIRSYARDYDATYVRVWCSCLPAGHVEKLRTEKLGSLPVAFRGLQLPIVTI